MKKSIDFWYINFTFVVIKFRVVCVQNVSHELMGIWMNFVQPPNKKMVNRPDSSSTRSDKSSSSRSSSMNRGISNKNVFVRSKSGNDYNDKGVATNRLRNSSSLQSITKSGGKSGMRKFKSNGRLVSCIKSSCLRHLIEMKLRTKIVWCFYHFRVFVIATIDLFTLLVYLCTTVRLRNGDSID